jgi:hypothetical protein
LRQKWTYKCPITDWFKAEFIANMAIIKNIKKNDKLPLYMPFKLRQKLMYAVHGDLLTGHDKVKKCKETVFG